MDHSNNLQAMLELLPGPAFAVRDGMIVLCNREAKTCLIEPGTPVNDILLTGQEEYPRLDSGCLYLSIHTAGAKWEACVTRLEDVSLFRLEQEGVPAEIKAMSLLCTELRYPVSNLSTLTERILAKAGDKTSSALANQEICKILRTLNNVSNAERYMSPGEHPLEERDICAIIRELLEETSALLEEANIHLHWKLPQQRIFTALNYDLLRQCVYNLLDNAAKFTEPGGAIEAELIQVGKSLRFTVTDQGCGIPPEERTSIFTRYTIQPGVREGRQSLGLGMALTRAAARLHGGAVLVDAPEHGGTRVTVTFSVRALPPTALRSPIPLMYVQPDDNALVMLSNVLPRKLYARY